MMVRQTSLLAYEELKLSGELGKRQKEVYDYLFNNPDSSDFEMAIGLGYNDRNAVAPRRKELLDGKWIESVDKRKCTITGRLVHVWRLV